MLIAGLAVLSFLLGSIPFGLIVSKAKGIDIRQVGSGNIGATNAIRALGPGLGLFVFVLDVLKGAIPAILVTQFIKSPILGIDVQAWSLLIGIVAILGHMFSPWLGFKGGKGVATGLGALIGSSPLTAALALALMVISTAITRYVSLSSIICAAAVLPISIFVSKDSPHMIPFIAIMAGVIIYKHRANIARLRNGTEPKFSFKKVEAKPDDSPAR